MDTWLVLCWLALEYLLVGLGCVGPDFNLQNILNIGDTWRRMTNLIKLLSRAFNYDCKFEHWNLKVNALLGIITFVWCY